MPEDAAEQKILECFHKRRAEAKRAAQAEPEPLAPQQPRQGSDSEQAREKIPLKYDTCGCNHGHGADGGNGERQAGVAKLMGEFKGPSGEYDGGYHRLLNGYWPKVPGRPWVFDGVRHPGNPGGR